MSLNMTLNIDKVLCRHPLRKSSVLARYQTHIYTGRNRELIRTIPTRHHTQRTTTTQNRFHFHIRNCYTCLCSDITCETHITSLIQLTLRINSCDHFLRKLILTLRQLDRKSTRLNSSHVAISYAV